MNSILNFIIPFGKYKNKPLYIALNDYSYIEWLKKQSILDKYPNILNIIKCIDKIYKTQEFCNTASRFRLNDDMKLVISTLFEYEKEQSNIYRAIYEDYFEKSGYNKEYETICNLFIQENSKRNTSVKLYEIIPTEKYQKDSHVVYSEFIIKWNEKKEADFKKKFKMWRIENLKKIFDSISSILEYEIRETSETSETTFQIVLL